MVAMLAFGGTFAYFTAKADNVTAGKVTTGTLKMGGSLTVTSSDKIVPNQTISTATNGITVTGNTVAAYRMKVEITSIKAGEVDKQAKDYPLLTVAILTEADEADASWLPHTDGYSYYNTLKKGDSIATLDKIANKVAIKLDATAGNEYQGLTVAYTITIEATQAEYFGTNGALAEGKAYTEATELAAFWG